MIILIKLRYFIKIKYIIKNDTFIYKVDDKN